MDIECISHKTNAPTNVGTSRKQKVHVTLSLQNSSIRAKNSSNVEYNAHDMDTMNNNTMLTNVYWIVHA
jgi:ethanolamine utilization protein EutP (predicted NTPase)